MATWHYYNEKGEKITVTGGQLKGLAKAGLITPGTMVETEDGKTAPARKVKGLTFQTMALPETPNPPRAATNPPTVPVPIISQTASQAVPPSVATPAAVEGKSSFLVTIIGIVAILIVGGIGWTIIKTTAPTTEQALDFIAEEQVEQALIFTVEEQAEIDRFLAKYGNDIKAVDNEGETLLYKATGGDIEDDDSDVVKRWDVAVAKYLVSKGADVNAKNNNSDGSSPLFAAANYANLEVVKYLVSKGADVNVKNNNDCTPLHIAVLNKGHLEVVEYLVSKGADVNAKDDAGCTPLYNATLLRGNDEIFNYLVSVGADVNAKSDSGMTPRQIANQNAQRTAQEQAAAQAERGTVPAERAEFVAKIEEMRKVHGDQILHLAVIAGEFSLVQYIVSIGVNVNARDELGNTPLHCAVQEEDVDIAQFLISKGANVSMKNNVSARPLFYAASHGNLKIAQLLVSEGADVDERSGDSNLTPLHAAAIEGHIDIARFLVSEGASIYATDVHGNTPLDMAIGKQHRAMIQYLRSVGVGPF